MLKPKVSPGDHFTILLLMFKIVGWIVILLAYVAMGVFKLGRSCARGILAPKRHDGDQGVGRAG